MQRSDVPPIHLPARGAEPAVRGRAARSNAASARFDALSRIEDAPLDGQLATDVREETPRRIITRNQSPDLPFDRSINAYRGCEHGCIYCFARPTHAWLGLSPGLDFETRLTAKPGAAQRFRAEIDRRGYVPAPLAMGTNTDPYQPIEKRFAITRGILEVALDCRHPVTITTKNHLVTRDIDLLAALAALSLVTVNVSVTTLDARLARQMEPRASAPQRRLAAIRALAAADVPVNVFLAPLIPAINDAEIEAILAAAARAGARGASCVFLRLPHEVAPLFEEWLQAVVPDRAARVMSLVRGMRAGRANDPCFHSRMRGDGPYAALLRQRFEKACTRHGLARDRHDLRADLFRRPSALRQPDLFSD